MNILRDKQILLGVCGSIAAYKVAELARNLTLAEARVDVVMTAAAQQFVGPATFQALTRRPVLTDMWALPEDGVVGHVSLGAHTDLIVIAPATANTLARLAAGISDDLLTTAVLATRAPVLCAPAMNPNMYVNAATQENIATLRRRGMLVLEPNEGLMAEPVTGRGRLPEPAALEGEIRALLGRRHGPLRGRRVVVTAGGTHEPIDPVRFIGNRSSGQMGYAMAACARDAGAHVTLVSGPTALTPPAAVEVVRVDTALHMRDAVLDACTGADILIMNAAVADFRPGHMIDHKIKKTGEEGMILHLALNPDILGEMAHRRDLFKVGFAAETDDLIANARVKLERKGLNLIIANDAVASIGRPDIQVTILDGVEIYTLPIQTKPQAAATIIDEVVQRFNRWLAHARLPASEMPADTDE